MIVEIRKHRHFNKHLIVLRRTRTTKNGDVLWQGREFDGPWKITSINLQDPKAFRTAPEPGRPMARRCIFCGGNADEGLHTADRDHIECIPKEFRRAVPPSQPAKAIKKPRTGLARFLRWLR